MQQKVGKLSVKLHLNVDESVKPVKLPVRKVSLAVRNKLKAELNRLRELGIIEPVDTPTDWISSIVVATKANGKIRLSIDPRPLNKVLKRNHYPTPVLEDLLPDLRDSKVLTMVDVKDGFWHIEIDNESSELTTFGTPWGRFKWLRMPFGISPAPGEFQRRLEEAPERLDGINPYTTIFLSTDAEIRLKTQTLIMIGSSACC